MAIPVYPSDLTNAEWALLAPLIPDAKPGGRPRSADMRRIVNGIFYVLRSGCAWRYLPREHGTNEDDNSWQRGRPSHDDTPL
jgi:transposase